MTDLICPNCKEIIGFKNVFSCDDEKLEILGIIYMMKCLNCGHQFVSDCRIPK